MRGTQGELWGEAGRYWSLTKGSGDLAGCLGDPEEQFPYAGSRGLNEKWLQKDISTFYPSEPVIWFANAIKALEMRSSCIWGPKFNNQHPHKRKEGEIQHADTQQGRTGENRDRDWRDSHLQAKAYWHCQQELGQRLEQTPSEPATGTSLLTPQFLPPELWENELPLF